MIWLTCHAGIEHLRPEAVEALTTWAAHDEIVFCYVGDDDLAYGLMLREAWHWNDDLSIIEPDIVIRRDVVQAFHACQHDYCAFPYEITTDVMPALGCTRFSWSFRREHADAMEKALLEPCGYGAGHFRSVDVALQRYVLARNGVQPHVHVPPVEHLNERQRLVEGADRRPLLEVPLW